MASDPFLAYLNALPHPGEYKARVERCDGCGGRHERIVFEPMRFVDPWNGISHVGTCPVTFRALYVVQPDKWSKL